MAFRISFSGGADPSRLGLVSLDGACSADGRGQRYTTLDERGGTPLGYVDGMLIVGRADGTVAAVPIDLASQRITGEPIPVLDQVIWFRDAAASLAANGALVYLRGSGASRIAFVDARGAVVRSLGELRRFQYPRISPDGRRVALEVASTQGTARDIWVYDLDSGVLSILTSSGRATRPEWTADGKRIAFIVEGGERASEAWWIPADKSGPAEQLYAAPAGPLGVREVVFSPDGRLALLRTGSAGGARGSDVWTLPLDRAGSGSERRLEPLLSSEFVEAMPRVSADGRWLAFVSDETGQFEVYVRPFLQSGGSVQVSSNRGAEPMWTRDGRLIYRDETRFVEATLRAAAAQRGATSPSIERRRVMFEGGYLSALPILAPPQFDVHPDGRLVVVRPIADDREVVVVLNWFEELRSRTRTRSSVPGR